MSLRRSLPLLLGVALGLSQGCGPSTPSGDAASTASEDTVLARVGGEPVTLADLERVAATTMGPGTLRFLDDATRQSLLESVVLTRAMAQLAGERMEAERRRELDAMVEAYRHSLLAQEFVRLETQGVALDEIKLRAYYEAHPEQFGQRQVRRYELLKGVAPPRGETQTRSLALLGELPKDDAEASLETFARREDVRAAGITFYRGELQPGLFPPRVQQLIESLDGSERSDVLIVERVPYVARVSGVETRPAGAFADVRQQVFERVRAVELKAALERLEGDVLAQVGVEYLPQPEASTAVAPAGTAADSADAAPAEGS